MLIASFQIISFIIGVLARLRGPRLRRMPVVIFRNKIEEPVKLLPAPRKQE